jgi:hypothetical protein
LGIRSASQIILLSENRKAKSSHMAARNTTRPQVEVAQPSPRFHGSVQDAEDLMDGRAITDLKSVMAPLNFLVPMAEKPVAYNYEPPWGHPSAPARASPTACPVATRGR